MIRVRPDPDALTTELCRLLDVERAALRADDVPSFVHARLRWCELVLTLCPGLAAAAPEVMRRLATMLPKPAAPVAPWRVEQRCRPLVPIVRRDVNTHTTKGAGRYKTAVEHLACGHTHRLLVVLDEDLRARRRRCMQCGKARLAALQRPAVTQASPLATPYLTVGRISVTKGGRRKSPEPITRTVEPVRVFVGDTPRLQ